jgi:hypothetical protein
MPKKYIKVNDVTRGFVYAILVHVGQQSVRATILIKYFKRCS